MSQSLSNGFKADGRLLALLSALVGESALLSNPHVFDSMGERICVEGSNVVRCQSSQSFDSGEASEETAAAEEPLSLSIVLIMVFGPVLLLGAWYVMARRVCCGEQGQGERRESGGAKSLWARVKAGAQAASLSHLASAWRRRKVKKASAKQEELSRTVRERFSLDFASRSGLVMNYQLAASVPALAASANVSRVSFINVQPQRSSSSGGGVGGEERLPRRRQSSYIESRVEQLKAASGWDAAARWKTDGTHTDGRDEARRQDADGLQKLFAKTWKSILGRGGVGGGLVCDDEDVGPNIFGLTNDDYLLQAEDGRVRASTGASLSQCLPSLPSLLSVQSFLELYFLSLLHTLVPYFARSPILAFAHSSLPPT